MSTYLLEINDLTVSYAIGKMKVVVLDGLDLKAEEGEVLGIVGESGSGKTTLGNAILSMIKPPGAVERGSILFQGRDVLMMDSADLRQIRWRGISVVPQASQNAFSPTMRIRDHFRDTMRLHGIHDKRDIEETSRSYLEELKLDPDQVLSAYPHHLSGGMKQRVAVALSLVLKPRLVVLDEPTSALDAVTQRVVLDLIKKTQKKMRVTMLFITHDISLVSGFCDRTAVLYGGKVFEFAPTDELLNSPVNPYTQSLLRAIPTVYGSIDAVKSIPGDPLSSHRTISGCKFHPRCIYAERVCVRDEPELLAVKPAHLSACHFPREVKMEMSSET